MALSSDALADKGRNTFDKCFGLFPMREVACPRNDLQPGSRDRLTPALAIGRCDYAVLGAPQQQGREVYPVQPAFEPRIVHVRPPAVEGEGFAAPNDRRQLVFPQFREIDIALCRIRPGQLQVLGPRPRILMPSGSTNTRCENRAVDRTIISAATHPPKQAPTSTAFSNSNSAARS